MPSRNKLPAYAAAVVTLLALGALAGTAVTPAAAQNLTTIRFGDQTGSEVDYAAVWVADMNGYYKDEGIQLERKTYANGPATLLDLNNLDAATAAIVPYMLFAARGGEVTMHRDALDQSVADSHRQAGKDPRGSGQGRRRLCGKIRGLFLP
jgi:ABC-type nitrate/sulfonate/bicarbonate transport system substrate-binding protein